MKKYLLKLVVSFLVFAIAQVDAEEGCAQDPCLIENDCCVDETSFYAKVLGGANFLQNSAADGNKCSYETGYVVAGAIGYRWHYGLCLEGEYAFRRNDINKIHFFGVGSSKHGHFQTSSFMANLLWNVPLSTWGCNFGGTQLFLGAGAGYDFQQMHASNSRVVFKQKWNRFSWQMMAGLAYPIFCHTELSFEYKFHQGGCHFNNHSIGVGLIYKFGFL